MKSYRIVGPPGCEPDWGINYLGKGKAERRAQRGDIVDDLPALFAAYLLGEGKIVEVPTHMAAPVVEETIDNG